MYIHIYLLDGGLHVILTHAAFFFSYIMLNIFYKQKFHKLEPN